MIRNNTLKLFLAGAAVLLWELILIRWMGSSIRIVSYYTNFILIASFLGLGIGAISKKYPLQKFIFPLLLLCILITVFFAGFTTTNPNETLEYLWHGAPAGLNSIQSITTGYAVLPYPIVLILSFISVVLVFASFGQLLRDLFQKFEPLKAYTIELSGSIFGVVIFAILSSLALTPPVWFVIAFLILLLVLKMRRKDYIIVSIFIISAIFFIFQSSKNYEWSPYYKIQASKIDRINNIGGKTTLNVANTNTYLIAVNNDFHQVAMNLGPEMVNHDFFKSWKKIYDLPYQTTNVPEGPILIVGAGTGNDVAAALRNTSNRTIYAVEIDPTIINLGKRYHPEHPYSNPRVRVINEDARSFFTRTNQKYSKVIFGFLDSHTLMSSFSSLRLDNFVYTKQSMEKVKNILLPGGEIYVTFASGTPWIHERIINLLDSVFDHPTVFSVDKKNPYTNGIVYKNGKANKKGSSNPNQNLLYPHIKIPTDDWPFLYMKNATVPLHYQIFIAIILIISFCSLLFISSENKKLKIPYFCLGASFFLIETSNITSLSILYGSTWWVNITVFMAILIFILLGTLTARFIWKVSYTFIFILLALSIVTAYIIPPMLLLNIEPVFVQAFFAGLIFLSPIFFASLIFANLIKNEQNLSQAYGSNLLGAAVGGSLEYLSLITGLKALLLIAFIFYVLTFIALKFITKRGEVNIPY